MGCDTEKDVKKLKILEGKIVKKVELQDKELTIVFNDNTAIRGLDSEYENNNIYIIPPPEIDYKKSYLILMEYWDSFLDEDKQEIEKRLKKACL